MHVVDIADSAVRPATGVNDQARRIDSFDELHDPSGVPLAPTFVVRDPQDDGGMVGAALDQGSEFGFKLLRGFRGAGDIRLVIFYILIAAWHVLPDEQPQLVTPIVPAIGLDLDVFAGE